MQTFYFCVFALALASLAAANIDPDEAEDREIAAEIAESIGDNQEIVPSKWTALIKRRPNKAILIIFIGAHCQESVREHNYYANSTITWRTDLSHQLFVFHLFRNRL